MVVTPKYPLAQVLVVKKGRVEKAEKIVQERKVALETEEKKLTKIEAEKDVVLQHHRDKLAQIREKLDTGTTSPEIQQMKAYLGVVKEKLVKEEARVVEQKKQVKAAEKKLEEARQELLKHRKEVEKIEMHKEQWEREMALEQARHEGNMQDEVGTTIHQIHKRGKK